MLRPGTLLGEGESSLAVMGYSLLVKVAGLFKYLDSFLARHLFLAHIV